MHDSLIVAVADRYFPAAAADPPAATATAGGTSPSSSPSKAAAAAAAAALSELGAQGRAAAALLARMLGRGEGYVVERWRKLREESAELSSLQAGSLSSLLLLLPVLF